MMTPEPSPGRRNSERGLAGALGAEELIEEILEEGIVAAARRGARPPARLGALDRAEVHDGGTHLLGDTDEALLQRLGHGGCRASAFAAAASTGADPGKPRMGEVAAGGADHHGDDDEDDTQDGPAHGAHTLAGRADDIDRRP